MVVELPTRIKNICGLRYGQLVVVSFSHTEKGSSYWVCKCDCGNTKTIKAESLKSQSTKSCGCFQKANRHLFKFKDLTAQKFGKLLVIRQAGYTNTSKPRSKWECKCDCGNLVIKVGENLTGGHTKSCGCYNKESIIKRCRKDISGRKFGKLTVIEYSHTVGKTSFWKCVCECNSIKTLPRNNLISGCTKSCGCQHNPKGEKSHNYNHNLTTEERIIKRNTPENREWEKLVKIRDNFTCQISGRRGGKLCSHHLDGYNWCKEKRLDINNGITLCEKVHKLFHRLYGKKNNTLEQFLDFKQKYQNTNYE